MKHKEIVCTTFISYIILDIGLKRATCIEHIEKFRHVPNQHVNMTVQTKDGDVFECIEMNVQPAFEHPLLRNHKIQVKPSSYPSGSTYNSSLVASNLQAELCTVECPPGTIPILRSNEGTIVPSLNGNEGEEIAAIQTSCDTYGARATINVYKPIVKNGDRSAAWLQINNEPREAIGAGNIVWPSFNRDNFARFHIYWVDSVLNKECYDLRCPGFVQVSKSVGIGGRLQPVSTYNGQQRVINIVLFKDPKTKNWWLLYGKDKTPLGYWPSNLFTAMKDKGDYSFVGGFVRGPTVKSDPPQMGSGYFASEGFRKAAYVENVQIVDKNNNFFIPELWYLAKASSTKEKCYTFDNFGKNGGGMHMYFGGPGGCS